MNIDLKILNGEVCGTLAKGNNLRSTLAACCQTAIIYIYEKEMATHSSILAWEIPWTEEPGGLQSMGSQRVRHDLET